MQKPSPPLGWLRTFECAGRHLSFTLAAEELRMTQSAVSQQIRNLESRLGRQLFVRKHRSVALTDDGRRLLPDIAQAINQLQSATTVFDQAEGEERLTLATSVSVAQWFLVPQLEKFIQCHPDANIRILTAVWPDEFSHVSADVQIRFGAKDNGQQNEQPLGKNRLTLVASPQLLRKHKITSLNANNIHRVKLIQAVGTSDTWANSASQFGIDHYPSPIINVDSHGLAVDFAQKGTGVALTSELISLPALTDGSLKRLHKKTIPADDGYFISTSSNSVNSLAESFVDWILREVELLESNLDQAI